MTESIDQQKKEYYRITGNQAHSPRTELAISLDNSAKKMAIDCGCGAGNEIAYLLSNDYRVHGFDSSKDSVDICIERYASNSHVEFSKNTFENFVYPDCSLLIAYNSLYFSDPAKFSHTWNHMVQSMGPNGVFSGDFLGLKDEWAHRTNIQINPLSARELDRLFVDFDVVSFKETDEIGKTALGHEKHWHAYSIVAKKCT